MTDLIKLTDDCGLPGPRPAAKYALGDLTIVISDYDDFGDGDKWKHVSISHPSREPTYAELLNVRRRMFPRKAEVVQVFPPNDEHVSLHPHCLHLWWNRTRRLTPPIMWTAIGPK